MRLLIAVDPSRMIYLEKFAFELSKFGIETKIIDEFCIYDNESHHRNILNGLKFQKI